MLRKRFHTTLDEELLKKLKFEAFKQNKSSNDIIEELLQNYFYEKNKKENVYKNEYC